MRTAALFPDRSPRGRREPVAYPPHTRRAGDVSQARTRRSDRAPVPRTRRMPAASQALPGRFAGVSARNTRESVNFVNRRGR